MPGVWVYGRSNHVLTGRRGARNLKECGKSRALESLRLSVRFSQGSGSTYTVSSVRSETLILADGERPAGRVLELLTASDMPM
jgi:hypothetical protein